MTDDDPTPPIRLVTEDERQDHFDEFEPGTPVVEHRMSRPPDPTDLAARIQKLEESHKLFQRVLLLVIPALLGGIVTALVYATDKISASSERVGETSADLRALKDRIKALEDAITELRSQIWSLRKQSKAEPAPSSGPDPDPHEDRYGVIDPQLPNAQRPHPVWGKIWHSRLLEQMSPQNFGVTPNWCANSSSSVGDGSLCKVEVVASGEGGAVPRGSGAPAVSSETAQAASIPAKTDMAMSVRISGTYPGSRSESWLL